MAKNLKYPIHNPAVLVDQTLGERLMNLYLSKQDQTTYDKYVQIADKLIRELAQKIEDEINKGNPPVTQKNILKNDSGIVIASNNAIPDYYNDPLFHIILQKKAEDNSLSIEMKVSVERVPMQSNAQYDQLQQVPILICGLRY